MKKKSKKDEKAPKKGSNVTLALRKGRCDNPQRLFFFSSIRIPIPKSNSARFLCVLGVPISVISVSLPSIVL